MSSTGWTWSEEWQDYYYVTYDDKGNPYNHWFGGPIQPRSRRDSVSSQNNGSNRDQMPEPALEAARTLPGFISGQTKTGWYHWRDPTFRIRTKSDVDQFFVVGRVFAMLHDEISEIPADVHVTPEGRDRKVQYVVIEVGSGWVYACPILKPNSQNLEGPYDKSDKRFFVHLAGTDPASCYLSNENEAMMADEPIEIWAADTGASIERGSYIRLSRWCPIEMTVRAKDVGRVADRNHLKKLKIYGNNGWTAQDNEYARADHDKKDTRHDGNVPEEEIRERNKATSHEDPSSSMSKGRAGAGIQESFGPDIEQSLYASPPNASDTSMTDIVGSSRSNSAVFETYSPRSLPYIDNRLVGDLHSAYTVINNPRGYYKKGKVFMVPWPEPSGDLVKGQTGPPAMVKIRRFVVVRPKATFCLCLPIHTYSGQGTSKPGIAPQDHVAVVPEGGEVCYHENEAKLTKSPVYIKVEDTSTGPVSPMARLNFAKIFTVEYNVKIRPIGRLIPDSIWRMDQYFMECLKFSAT